MPNELIATLIKFLPTILVGLSVFGCMIAGFFRGFRKSNILFIHYLLALIVGFVAYFVLSKQVFTMDLNSLFALMGGEYANAHTIYEFVKIALEQFGLEAYSSLADNYYFQGIIQALAGLLINFVLALVTLVILPCILRAIFRLFYWIFYSERKHKKHKSAEGEEYHKHRLLGMCTGLIRGIICATLTISLFNSLFFIIAGGDYYEKGEEAKNISLLEKMSSDTGLDFNLYYNALKESRTTGVGAVYEAIKIKGVPIDYFYSDLFVTSTFNTYNHSKNDEVVAMTQILNATLENGSTATFNLREETALIFRLIEGILETNAITIVDDTVEFDEDKLLNEIPKVIEDCVNDSKLFSDIIPLAIISAVDEIQKGNISVHPDIDEYIKENDIYSKARQLDLPADIAATLNSCVSLLKLFVNKDTGQLDLSSVENPIMLLELDPEDVSAIFNGLSEVSLITDIVFPIGMGIAFNSLQTQLTDFGISTDDIDLSIIDWKAEIANLGTIYTNISKLELDTKELTRTEVNNDTGKTYQMEYLTNYVKNDENKDKLLVVVDSVMDSNLTSQFMLVMLKKYVSDLTIVNEDGSESKLNTSLEKVKANLNNRDENGKLIYNVDILRKDMHTFVESCLGILELFSVFGGENTNPLEAMKNIDVESLRAALVGDEYKSTGKVTGGIYQIRFLSGDLDDKDGVDPDMNDATDEMIEALLKAYTLDYLYESDIDSVKNKHGWPAELSALVDFIEVVQKTEGLSEIDFNTDLMTNFPQITDEGVDELTISCSKSILLGGMMKGKVKDALVDNVDNNSVTVNVSDDDWLDKFDKNGNLYEYGELNKIIKVLILVNNEDNKIDLSNSDSIMEGLAKLDPKEVDKLTASQIIRDSLDDMVAEMLYPEESDKSLPEVTWETTYKEDGKVKELGELQKLVNILNIEKLQTVENAGQDNETKKFDVKNLEDIDTIASLNSTEVDILTASTIVKDLLDEKVGEMLYPDEEGKTLDIDVTWETTYKEDGKVKELGELQKLVNILNIEKLQTVENAGQDNETKKFDVKNLEDIDTIAQLISINDDDTLNYSDVETLATSKLAMSMMSDKVSNISSGDITVVVPDKLKYDKEIRPNAWELWAYSSGYDYKNGQFGKMVYSLFCARQHILSLKDENNNNLYSKLENSNLVEGIIGISDHSVITNSLVMYATISNKLIDLSEEKDPVISIRDVAKITNENELDQNDNIIIKKTEVILALDSANELGLNDFENVNTELIIDEIRLYPEKKEKLCKSNIMNKTVVDKLINNSEGTLKFPSGYSNSDEVLWYPSNNSSWELCELNKVLDSVIKLTDGENAGIIISGNTITSNTNKLFKDLSTPVDTTKTKLDVIYLSEVMAFNITDKIKGQDTITIRPIAYIDSNTNNNLKKEEVKILVSFLNDSGFKIDQNDDTVEGKPINAENLLLLVENQDDRASMCFSNILNITIIEKITASKEIKIPLELELTLENAEKAFNLEDPDWYPAEGLTVTSSYDLWSVCELNHLLLAVHELQQKDSADEHAVIEVSGNDIQVYTEQSIYTLNETAKTSDDTKIEVVYNSLVMAQTISDYIIEQDNVVVPLAYYPESGAEAFEVIVNDRIVKEEVVTLVDAINILNITLDDNYVATQEEIDNGSAKVKMSELKASNITAQSEEDIELIFTSAIISLKTSEILESKKSVEIPTNAEFMVTRTDGVNEEAVYSLEISELLKATKEFNFDVDRDDHVTFNLSKEFVDKGRLEIRLGSSDVFHATMSVQIKIHVTYVPKYYYQTYENVESKTILTTKLGEGEYLTCAEIANSVGVLQDLGFSDTDSAMEGISSEYLSQLSEEQVANLDKSGIIAAMITHKLTGVEIPNTPFVANTVDMLKGAEENDNKDLVINGNEVKALALSVIGITPEGKSLNIADTSNLKMADLDANGLEEGINSSYILRATLSKKIVDSGATIPNKDITGSSTKDDLGYLIGYEINSLVQVFKVMNLDFDSINSDSLSKISIAAAVSNVDAMLKSAIIHSLLSENLISQKQTITGIGEFGIVTYEFMEDDETKINVATSITSVAEHKYIYKNEIKLLLEGLQTLGITDMANASNIGLSNLETIAKNVDQRASVKASAILSTIIGNILINQTLIVDANEVYSFNRVDNEQAMQTLAQSYVDELLTAY